MNALLKGALTGLASFAAGFALLSVVFPPSSDGPDHQDVSGLSQRMTSTGVEPSAGELAAGSDRIPDADADLALLAPATPLPTGDDGAADRGETPQTGPDMADLAQVPAHAAIPEPDPLPDEAEPTTMPPATMPPATMPDAALGPGPVATGEDPVPTEGEMDGSAPAGPGPVAATPEGERGARTVMQDDLATTDPAGGDPGQMAATPDPSAVPDQNIMDDGPGEVGADSPGPDRGDPDVAEAAIPRITDDPDAPGEAARETQRTQTTTGNLPLPGSGGAPGGAAEDQLARFGPPGVGNPVPPSADPAPSPTAAQQATLPVVPADGQAAAEPRSVPESETDLSVLSRQDQAEEPGTQPLTGGTTDQGVRIRRPDAGQQTVLRPAPTGRLAPGTSVEGVMLGRLPQVGAPLTDRPGTEMETSVAQTGAEGHEVLADGLPRWRRHAAAITPSDLPRVGLVLLDLTRDLDAEAALVELPFAVTVGLDPFDPDSARRALIYRAAGHEIVLSLAGVSPLSTSSDLEVLFAAWLEDFPETLGVVDPPPGDGRRARALAQTLMPLLSDTGLALLAADRGLSPLLTAARAGQVAQAGLYRSLDPADESAEAVRRFLDRAAFEAERQGSIAVIGRADRPETREGIAIWLAGSRATRVQAVPAGAVVSVQGQP